MPDSTLISLLLAITSPVLVAQNGSSAKSQLLVEPELIRTMYCSNKPGVITLDVQIQLTYKNMGPTTVIMPKFSKPKQYNIFSSAVALHENRPSGGLRFSTTQFFDLSKMDLTIPDQTIFHFIEPGGSRANLMHVIVLLRHPTQKVPKEPLWGKDTYLVVEINHWFWSYQFGEKLQRRWQKFGELWIENVVAPPLRLPIESSPVVQRCQASVD